MINENDKKEITKEQFEAYEAVRTSGVTNMFDIRVVTELSGLSKEEVLDIMNQYEELDKKYLDRR